MKRTRKSKLTRARFDKLIKKASRPLSKILETEKGPLLLVFVDPKAKPIKRKLQPPITVEVVQGTRKPTAEELDGIRDLLLGDL